MDRLTTWLLTILVLLCGMANHASAKALYPEKLASGGLGQSGWESTWGLGPQTLETQWENEQFPAWIASDVCHGPNVYTYVRQNPWTKFDPLGLESSDEKKWKALAPDTNQSFGTRALATVMSVAESLNPFRSDSSIRQGGRDLQEGLAAGREQLKQAPPGIRELGQLSLGVGSAGTGMMSVPAGIGEMGGSIQQQGAVNTGKQMVSSLVNHAMSNPVEFAGELGVGILTGKAMLGSTARTTAQTSAAAAGEIAWPPNRGFLKPPDAGTLQPGSIVDRFGGPSGTFVAPQGTPFAARSLPADFASKPLNAYQVLKPIRTDAGVSAPWFKQPGGGAQFELPKPVQKLIESGHLRSTE